MPGSFTFENTLSPKLDVSVGARSHIFQPPPTSATSSLHFSHASLATSASKDDRSNTKRKRSRRHETDFNVNQPSCTSTTTDAWSSMAYDSPLTSACDLPGGMESPAPFVNEKYKLAGGLDTPTSKMSLDHEYFNLGSGDFHSRTGRNLASVDLPYHDDTHHNLIESALARERNGRPRVASSPNIRDGLGRTLYHVAGVAGKLLEFCRTAAFRGFFAGGGAGFELKRATTEDRDGSEKSIWHQVEEKDRGFWRDAEDTGTPVPGRFLENDFIPDYMSQDHIARTPIRTAKRIQREKGMGGEIGENWMMVGERGTPPDSREASPSRISTRKLPTSAASPSRRAAPKLGRRPVLPASRPSLTSYAGSPGLRSDRPASYASPRSPGGTQSSPKHETSSPVSVEVQKHVARIRRRELEEDKNLSKFNQQLKAMIREGKEALGTRVDVEDDIG